MPYGVSALCLHICHDRFQGGQVGVDIAEEVGGTKLKRDYKLDAPKGVRGRNSDNTKIMELLDWEPSIPLTEGIAKTYAWIEEQYEDRKAGIPTPAGDH